jgi:hypothetical protein
MLVRAIGISLIIISIVLLVKSYSEGVSAIDLAGSALYLSYDIPISEYNNETLYARVDSLTRFLFVGAGDKIHFFYQFKNVTDWQVSIVIKRIATGQTWNWTDTGPYTIPRSVEFIAPSRGLYFINITVIYSPSTAQTYYMLKRDEDIRNDQNYLYILLLILGSFITVLSYIFRFENSFEWEIKSYYKWIISPVVAFISVYYSNNFTVSASAEEPALALYNAVDIHYNPTWLIFLIISSIVFVTTFSYEFSEGSIRDMLLTTSNRNKLFFFKILANFTLIYLPLILTNLISYLLTDPLLITKDFGIIISGIPIILFNRFLMVSAALCYVLIPAVFLTRPIFSFSFSILPAFMLINLVNPSYLPQYNKELAIALLLISLLLAWIYFRWKNIS